ncbi:MAG: DUF6265 family protein [Candidatus Cloacimonadales bacterium]|nr:DUF6265 family protein [Candidatus Cloacimonadales bacterium]
MNLNVLGWLAGSWLCKTENHDTEEFWQIPKGNLMLGLNRTVSSGEKTTFEFLRIFQREDEIFYAASPNGKSATFFKLIESENRKAIFENPEHDFPQRIIYNLLKSNKLFASIEGEMKGEKKRKEWLFVKVK